MGRESEVEEKRGVEGEKRGGERGEENKWRRGRRGKSN